MKIILYNILIKITPIYNIQYIQKNISWVRQM